MFGQMARSAPLTAWYPKNEAPGLLRVCDNFLTWLFEKKKIMQRI
jgi:hypothetical protein